MQSRWVLVALGVRLTGKPKISTVVFAAVLKEEIEQLRDRDARHTYRITHLVRNLEEEEKANARLKYQVCKRASFSFFSPSRSLSLLSVSLSLLSGFLSALSVPIPFQRPSLSLCLTLSLSLLSAFLSALSLPPPFPSPFLVSIIYQFNLPPLAVAAHPPPSFVAGQALGTQHGSSRGGCRRSQRSLGAPSQAGRSQCLKGTSGGVSC